MYRYAMKNYKAHYACFNCRKAFKRRLLSDIEDKGEAQSKEAKCPECGQLMADMGLDFEAPGKKNIPEWAHLKLLYSVGIAFHSCGCSGPGYIPDTTERLIDYFQEKIAHAQHQLRFWRKRKEPASKMENKRDSDRYQYFRNEVAYAVMAEDGHVYNEDAKKFWIGRIAALEGKLMQLQTDAADRKL